MEGIKFFGKICGGVGRYVELYVPGRNEIIQAPGDWPFTLYKGSLNVCIDSDGYPPVFSDTKLPDRVQSLDMKPFPPAFEIKHHQFGNNQLHPDSNMPNKGSAQVWRAILITDENSYPCWVLRRYGSRVGEQLELLSDVHMRTAYDLSNGQNVAVELERGDA